MGESTDPPIVLIPGSGQAGHWWTPEFCRQLAAGHRFVVCHEHRIVDPRPERLPDLAQDTLSTMDALGIDAAHLVGAGLGGTVAARVAVAHPDRVRTLAVVDTEPIDGAEQLIDGGSSPLVMRDRGAGPVSTDLVPTILRHTSGTWAEQADRLARAAYRRGRPTGWFDELYSQAETGAVATPWNRVDPHPLLVEWAAGHGPAAGRTAIVVGCGLGADAEYLQQAGFTTTAFDISPAAIRLAHERHPDSSVIYRQADLLALPASWVGVFDLVVDVFTVQALPDPPRSAAMAGAASLVAPGGRLVAVALARIDESGATESGAAESSAAESSAAESSAAESGTAADGPPWPLTRSQIAGYAQGDLIEREVTGRLDPSSGGIVEWLAEFHRPTGVR